ncbi:MAG: DUF3261 domain-containing protein [Planctomycetes bacterium]|nr:DUF3261 domain-containing protein [Planctomycetota bacterium]
MRAAPLLALALAACAAAPSPEPPPADYPGELVPTAEIPGAFLWRQQVRAEHGARVVSFEAALQKKGDALTVLGLTPYGTRAFVLEQRGTEVAFTNHLPPDQALPFPPRHMLLDIHRAWFVALPGAPLPDGEHAGERHGEQVTEVWRGGRVIERRYRRLDDRPAGLIVVRYGEPGMAALEPPGEVVLDNGWFGYRLVVRTLEARRL